MKKGALQISFAWLFAIIVGAIILFLAIYGVIKFTSTEQTIQDAKTGKDFGILLNPLETGFEESKSSSLTMPVDTRIYNRCDEGGTFGKQIIKISQLSFNKWTETNVNISFENKYLFSEKYVEGKKFYIFSKPFKFPFKVTDLIYITSSEDKYCFKDAPPHVQEELEDLNQENLILEEVGCPENSINVCFEDSNCEINVNLIRQKVVKNEDVLYFEGDALMYAAIFSDKDVYECQLQRIMKKTEQLGFLYLDKKQLITQTVGCDSDANVALLINFAINFQDSLDIRGSESWINNLDTQNKVKPDCMLW